jgi:uncharacterized lipoprotein
MWPNSLDEDFSAPLLDGSAAADLDPPEGPQAWEPLLMLLSVASGNRRARPAPEVLQAVQGYKLLRMGQNGWVHLSTDGEQLWVEAEKKWESNSVGLFRPGGAVCHSLPIFRQPGVIKSTDIL